MGLDPESRFDRDGSEAWRAVVALHGDDTDDWEDDVGPDDVAKHGGLDTEGAALGASPNSRGAVIAEIAVSDRTRSTQRPGGDRQ